MTDHRISSADDVVTYLKGQHEAIRALFVETLDAKTTETQQEAFTRLRTMLAVHETAEEMMVHPRIRRKIDGGAAIADARLTEEHDAKVALGKLEKIPCGTADFSKELIHLQAAVLEHAEREEADEFTLLEQHLDAEELASLATAVRSPSASRRPIPTRVSSRPSSTSRSAPSSHCSTGPATRCAATPPEPGRAGINGPGGALPSARPPVEESAHGPDIRGHGGRQPRDRPQ